MCNPNTRIYIHAYTHAHTHTGNNAPSSLAESPRTNLRRFFAFACSRARRRAARARAADTLGARSSATSPPSRRVSVATVAMESACSREKQRGRLSRVRGGIKHTLRCAQKMPRTLPASEKLAWLCKFLGCASSFTTPRPLHGPLLRVAYRFRRYHGRYHHSGDACRRVPCAPLCWREDEAISHASRCDRYQYRWQGRAGAYLGWASTGVFPHTHSSRPVVLVCAQSCGFVCMCVRAIVAWVGVTAW